VENVKEIFLFGEVNINTKLLDFLNQKKIIMHYFNYYDYYSGSFYPREFYNSGYMILNQVKYYLDYNKRLILAKKFVEGATKNCLKILKYYNRRYGKLENEIKLIENYIQDLKNQETIENLMQIEGKIKSVYYNSFNKIIEKSQFKFNKRTKRPPLDEINALISFSNMLIYSYVLSDIYQTHLDPRIGYLHTTNFRRFTLNLDVAEIFKPVIGDRTILSSINKGIINTNDFEPFLKGLVLNEKGKKKFLQQIEDRMKQTIKHSSLKKNVSYRNLIKLELYKIEKHLMNEKEYKPFVMDW
jgi:CRISPR-associated protein Cas1